MQLSESLCSVNYVQPHVFQTLEENLDDMTSFRGWWLFSRWSKVVFDLSDPPGPFFVLIMQMRRKMLYLYLENARNLQYQYR